MDNDIIRRFERVETSIRCHLFKSPGIFANSMPGKVSTTQLVRDATVQETVFFKGMSIRDMESVMPMDTLPMSVVESLSRSKHADLHFLCERPSYRSTDDPKTTATEMQRRLELLCSLVSVQKDTEDRIRVTLAKLRALIESIN